MLAWILNTKPDILVSSGFTSRVSESFGLGDGAISTKQSSNSDAKIIQSRSKKRVAVSLQDIVHDRILDKLHRSVLILLGAYLPAFGL
jgi:hypothetical protein